MKSKRRFTAVVKLGAAQPYQGRKKNRKKTFLLLEKI
jgi:hypothetical protein